FQIQGAAAFNYQGGSPRFDNAGTFLPSPTGTTAFYSIPFNNYGAINLAGGIFALDGGYLCTSNSVVNYAIDGKTPGTNFAQVQASGGITLNGTLNVNLTNHYVPTTNDSFTLVSAGTRNGAFSNFTYSSNNVSMVLSNTATSVIVRVTSVALQQTALSAPGGIISWWRAESNALDFIGTNNGALTNGASYGAGEVGQSFLLDGTSGYMVIPDSPSLEPVSVTVEAWVKIFSTNGTQLIFAKPLGSGTFDSYGLALVNGAPLAAICDTSGFGTFVSINNALTLGQWYHLAYTYDGTSGQEALYVNGAAVASANAGKSMSYDAHPLLLGADIENGLPSYFLNGQIDEATIYNRALGANEIASIYNAGSLGKELPFELTLSMERIAPGSARLSWSTNYSLYHLQSNTNLGSTNWAAAGLTPVVTGATFVVTNSLSGSQMYYRLSQ
ncbi:MAG TPA: LamG domain-containing protein, partial [Verrucomicrobiae bacterium]|nr:LamG domain-containing protein [Verrucomicrobiae bacterium]